MKTIKTLAIASIIGVAALSATSAQAFWGWNNGNNNGWGNGFGNGDGAFDFSMSARGNSNVYGNGYNGWNGYNGYHPYGYAPYAYAPVAAPAVNEKGELVAPQAPAYAAPYAPYPYAPRAFAAPAAPAQQ